MADDIKTILAGAAKWWVIMCVVFFVTFPWIAPLLLAVLRFVLEGLSGFGAGWR